MRRVLLLTIPLLTVVSFLPLSSVNTQQADGSKLPSSTDLPAAASNCKKRVSVTPWVGTPGVDWPNTFHCVLKIHTCEGVKSYTSEVRRAGTGMCDDYWKLHNELARREICCDEGATKKPCQPPTPPWFDRSSECKDVQKTVVTISGGTALVYACGVRVFNQTDMRFHETQYAEDYRSRVNDLLRRRGLSQICCDRFREAVQSGSGCDPRKNLDCIGADNNGDITPDYWVDAIPAGFGLTYDDLKPTAQCGEGCEWELIKGDMKFQPKSYTAKWRCPVDGAVVDVMKEVKP